MSIKEIFVVKGNIPDNAKTVSNDIKFVDRAILQHIMGHNDIKTTLQTYNHVDVERVRKEIEARTDLHNIYTINV